MFYQNINQKTAYESQMAEWQPRYDFWLHSDSATRSEPPVEPVAPATYDARQHSGPPEQIKTRLGPIVVMDKVWIFTNTSDPADVIIVHDQDLSLWTQVA